MSTIPNKANFHLTKVKLDPQTGLAVNYQITITEGDDACVIDRAESSSREVHPDLKQAIEELRGIVCDTFGLPEDVAERIEPRGVAYSGNGKARGVVITAILEAVNGTKAALNTPRIKVEQSSFGFEEELSAMVDVISNEVYAYLFEGKQARLSLFGEQPGGAFNPAE